MRRYRNLQASRVIRWQSLVATLLAGLALVCTIMLYSQLQPTGLAQTSASPTQLMAVEPPTPAKIQPGQLVRWVAPKANHASAPTRAIPLTPLTRKIQQVGPPTFNGKALRSTKQMAMLVTAYSPDARSCGIHADGITASGYSVWTNGMKLVAADTRLLPFGTIISIPGYNRGQPVQVLDRGGKIKGHRLDVLYPTHEIARQFGVQKLNITVWQYAD